MKTPAHLLLFVLILAVVACNSAAGARAPDPDALFAQYNFSGSAAFSWTGHGAPVNCIFKRNYGSFNPVFKSAPWPENPTYPIASNSKVYSAIGLSLLVQRGLVKSLNDSIADYLTPADLVALGVQGNNVTRYCPIVQGDKSGTCQTVSFAQLLSMSAGIADDYQNQILPWPGTTAGVIARYDISSLQFVPGTQYYYSNPSFMLTAFFIEKLMNTTFQAFVASIARRLGTCQ